MRDNENSGTLHNENAIQPTFEETDAIIATNSQIPPIPPRINYEVPINFVSSPYVYPNQNYGHNLNHSLSLPPRPPTPSSSPYNSSFSPMTYPSNLGGYYTNQRSYGPVSSADIRWSEHADSVVRPIFRNIESFVNALTGISSLLDTAFSSIVQTFRTISGLADSFNNIKDLFDKIWSYLAIFKMLKLIYKKLLIFLKLRSKSESNSDFDLAWSQATCGASQINEMVPVLQKKDIFVQFSVLAYFSVVLFGPFLISKFMKPSVKPKSSSGDIAIVVHDFNPKKSDELRIRKGEKVKIAPRIVQEKKHTLNTGWVFVCSGKNYGIVPLNHLEIM